MRRLSFEPAVVLKDLRSARRKRRIADFDAFEALYRAYLTGITLSIGVLLLSGTTGDTKIIGSDLTAIRLNGGAWVGLAVALAFAVGLRSGGRGGPLVVEAADVRHVLLAPVDRSVALRGPAIRQLRFLLLAGVTTGGIAGLLALRRLPGPPVAWVATGAAAGALAVAGGFGLALVVSGHRLGRWVGGILAILVLAWSGADVAWHRVTSPATMLGRLALWPLAVHPVDVVGPVVALAALVVGLLGRRGHLARGVGAPGRAGGPDPLRGHPAGPEDGDRVTPPALPGAAPAATMDTPPPGHTQGRGWRPPGGGRGGAPGGDVRACGPAAPKRWLPVWRRGWHGILRWPALRLARVAVLGAVAGTVPGRGMERHHPPARRRRPGAVPGRAGRHRTLGPGGRPSRPGGQLRPGRRRAAPAPVGPVGGAHGSGRRDRDRGRSRGDRWVRHHLADRRHRGVSRPRCAPSAPGP